MAVLSIHIQHAQMKDELCKRVHYLPLGSNKDIAAFSSVSTLCWCRWIWKRCRAIWEQNWNALGNGNVSVTPLWTMTVWLTDLQPKLKPLRCYRMLQSTTGGEAEWPSLKDKVGSFSWSIIVLRCAKKEKEHVVQRCREELWLSVSWNTLGWGTYLLLCSPPLTFKCLSDQGKLGILMVCFRAQHAEKLIHV